MNLKSCSKSAELRFQLYNLNMHMLFYKEKKNKSLKTLSAVEKELRRDENKTT